MKNLFLIVTILFVNFVYSQTDSYRKLPSNVVHTTQSYIMNWNETHTCYTIWVGVFETSDEQTILISSGVVQIGECTRLAISNSICENSIYKGDYIINSDSKGFKYCLTECLQDDGVYAKYQADKYRILAEIKK